jgi:hypothetical protein
MHRPDNSRMHQRGTLARQEEMETHHDTEEDKDQTRAEKDGANQWRNPRDGHRRSSPREDEQPSATSSQHRTRPSQEQLSALHSHSRKENTTTNDRRQTLFGREVPARRVHLLRVPLVLVEHDVDERGKGAYGDAHEGEACDTRAPAPSALEDDGEGSELHLPQSARYKVAEVAETAELAAVVADAGAWADSTKPLT